MINGVTLNPDIESPGTLLTVDEVAQRLNISEGAARDMMRSGELNTLDQRGEPRISIDSLRRYQGQVRLQALTRGSDEEVDEVL